MATSNGRRDSFVGLPFYFFFGARMRSICKM
jgi:hypothetical protein